MAAPAERGPIDELSMFFQAIPVITRTLFCGSFGLSLLARFGILHMQHLVLIWQLVAKKLQVWRLATSLLAYPMGWGLFMNLYFLYQYSRSLEEGMFARRRADYVFFLIFVWALAIPAAIAFSLPFLLEILVMALVYVWALDNRDQIVSFFFGMQFKAMYLPIVLVVFDVLTNSPTFLDKCIGCAIGHLFVFLDKMYPEQNDGQRILQTPSFLVNLLGNEAAPPGQAAPPGFNTMAGGQRLGRASGGAQPNTRPMPSAPAAAPGRPAADGVRYRWGTGNRLGE
ncbi:Derlin 1 [Phlyctochytrium planicorne]|nr:Derlin 1 [Phlyctochytrium planicorne]